LEGTKVARQGVSEHSKAAHPGLVRSVLQFTGGFLLIAPSVLFIFLVRRQLFAMWGIANR